MTTWLSHPHANGSHRLHSAWHDARAPRPHWREPIRLGIVVSLAAVTIAVVLTEFADLSAIGLAVAVAFGALLVSALQVSCFTSRNEQRRTEPDPHDHRRSHVPLTRAA